MTVKLKASFRVVWKLQCLINFIFLSQKFSVHSAPHYEEQSGPKTHGFRSCRFTKNYLITIHMHSGKMTTPLPLFSILFWIPIYHYMATLNLLCTVNVWKFLCVLSFFSDILERERKKLMKILKKKTEKIKAKQKPQSPPVLKNFPL